MIKEPDKESITREYINEITSNNVEVHIPNDNFSCILFNIPLDNRKYIIYIPCNEDSKLTKNFIEQLYAKFTLNYIIDAYKDLVDEDYFILSEVLNNNISNNVKKTNSLIKKIFRDERQMSKDEFYISIKDDNILDIKFKSNENIENVQPTP